MWNGLLLIINTNSIIVAIPFVVFALRILLIPLIVDILTLAFLCRQRCFSPLWIAFSILIGGLLLDVLVSVSLGVSALPVNIIIGNILIPRSTSIKSLSYIFSSLTVHHGLSTNLESLRSFRKEWTKSSIL